MVRHAGMVPRGAARARPPDYGAAMALAPGDVVDDFELPDQTGAPRRLSTLLDSGPVVLFFYPAAMTSGCTKESCHFRDLAGEFAAAGGQRVGISRDGVEKQAEFADKHAFDYPLLSDPDGTVAAMFGVSRRVGPPQRVTFVIDRDRRIVEVIKSELRMNVHADRALEALRAL
jgi:peroxiredoxin Q/BCP